MWSDTSTCTNEWYNTATTVIGDCYGSTTDTGNYITLPDSLINWFPNSCLYTKYIPTWHLLQSYRVD